MGGGRGGYNQNFINSFSNQTNFRFWYHHVDIPLQLHLHCQYQMCIFLVSLMSDVHQRSNTSQVSVNNSTGRFARQHCPRKGFGQAEQYPGIICHPLRLHPERNRPVGQQWQMLPPSVPAGRPAASATIPAERVLPAAVAPLQTIPVVA